jgi:SET domain-containing protein
VATFKENGELYGEAVRRFKSPPYARFFTLGGDNVTHTVGDGRLNETSLRDEMTYASFVSDDMGFGLFAAKNISAGTPLGIYTGIVREHIRNTDYSWEYNIAAVVKGSNGETVELSVDALLAGNNMRFVNHAHNSDDLNVEQRYIPVDGVWYVMYITTDDVRMHDQLWVSYGDEYWKVRKMKEEDDEEE